MYYYPDDERNEREIAEELILRYSNTYYSPQINIQDLTNRDFILKNAYPYLVNKTLNETILDTCPWKDIAGDIIVTYKIRFETEIGIGSVLISNEIMNIARINSEELHENAIKNLDDVEVVRIAKVMKDMYNIPDNEFDRFIECSPPMYIISNTDRMNGASAILNKECMDQVSKLMGSDFYIIPSSIHECIAAPCSIPVNELMETISYVNETTVMPEEKLSDYPLAYINGEITRLSE